MPEGYFFVKNWWKYQHYKDRHPPWIKLHHTFFTDPQVQELSETDQWRLVRLWIVAADMEGRLPQDAGYIQARLGLYHRLSSTHLLATLEAIGLISQQDIRGDRSQSAIPRQRQRQGTLAESEPEPPIVPLSRGTSKKARKTFEYSEFFLAFWEAYPRKIGKGEAAKAFEKAQVNGNMPAVIVAIESYKKTSQWQDAQFIPHPATWLNQRRWEDEPGVNGGLLNAPKPEPSDARGLAWQPQPNWPTAPEKDGIRLDDSLTSKVIAISKDGKWVEIPRR